MPKRDLPDPTGKTVIILAGEFAGHEGFCLGTTGEENVFAVTPTVSNRILHLLFDEEFGVLINSGQKPGKN